MRFYFNKKGISGVSVSTGRNNGGCGTLLCFFFILYLVGHFSTPSDEDIQNESVSYKVSTAKPSSIVSEICDQYSTDDSAQIFFDKNLEKHWYKARVKINSLSNQRLSAADINNPNLSYEVKMNESKSLKIGSVVAIEFVPTGFTKYSCKINGTIGKYK